MTIKIWGRYKNGESEVLDDATDQNDADFLVGEYRMAYGSDWLIWQGRKKDGTTETRSEVPVRKVGNVLFVHEHVFMRR